MLYYASLFFIISVIALLLVIFGHVISGAALLIAKIGFVVFLVLFVSCLIIDRAKKHRKKRQ